MSYYFGSIPIMFYPAGGEGVPVPPAQFLLITDGTNFLMTDTTPLKLAGT